MIRVLLADDEPMIVKGLNKLINWKKYGMKIVGTASDGAEALKLVREKEPELLISDINMPELTGIELLKSLNSENSRTRVIFISGFHEFEYAHAAIKFGAVDYLLKPINKLQLETAILKAVKTNRREEIVYREDDLEQLPADFPEKGRGYYTVLNCRIISKTFVESEKSEQEILHFSAVNLMRDYISNRENHWIINKNSHIFLVIFHSDEDSLNRMVKELAPILISLIEEKLNEKLIIAIGKTVMQSHMLKDAYLSSQETMDNRFFCSDDSVLYYRNPTAKRYSIDDLYTIQGDMTDAIHKNDKKRLKEKSESYFNILKDVTFGNKEATISFCLGTIISMKKSLENSDMNLQILDFDDQLFLKEIHNHLSFNEMSLWVSSFLEKLFAEACEFRENCTHPEIQRIKSYIADHYNENIKLQDLADIVYLHPNYLSGHFKKHTGQNFKDYLTEIRMKEAEKMFLTTDLRIYEISEKVGFTDYRHFSEVFKKKFGVNPRDFRKKAEI